MAQLINFINQEIIELCVVWRLMFDATRTRNISVAESYESNFILFPPTKSLIGGIEPTHFEL